MPTSVLSAHLVRVARAHPPEALVENRVAFGSAAAEFAVYDTVRPAAQVALRAENPLFCGMVTGRKRVHTEAGQAIDFVPAESLVVPSGQTVRIDFPGASDAAPTKCLTIEIDRAAVARIVERMNETAPLDGEAWAYADAAVCHFENPPGLAHTVRQLVGLFVEGHPDREVLIGLGVSDLVVRMLRLEARRVLLAESARASARSGLAAAAEWARARLHQPLAVADLARAACMSEAAFYRAFRAAFGQTPLAWLTAQRVALARRRLARGEAVGDVAAGVGFASAGHFGRVFRQHVGLSPKQFQLAQRGALAGRGALA